MSPDQSSSACQIMDLARSKIDANLKTACSEINQWRKTGILPDGVVRDVANHLSSLDAHGSHRLAEALVVSSALKFVVNSSDPEDFPLGQACDLSGDGPCDSCQ